MGTLFKWKQYLKEVVTKECSNVDSNANLIVELADFSQVGTLL